MYEGMCYGTIPYLVYDGTNSAAIRNKAEDQYGTWTVSESGGVLTITKTYAELDENNVPYHDDWTVNNGDYVLFGNLGGMAGVYSQENFDLNYAIVDDALNQPVLIAMGIESVPSINGGASSSPISVTLKPALADSDYAAVAILAGGLGLLSKLEVSSVTVVDEDTVSVVVHNTGLLPLSGAQVLVQAVHN